uniref:Uncharacterized protein n=1 Tax=Anguilla anguilla TaxID=7936 RepID=A0A0E9R4G5_ANGAN
MKERGRGGKEGTQGIFDTIKKSCAILTCQLKDYKHLQYQEASLNKVSLAS